MPLKKQPNMPRIILDIRKNIDENAAVYFEKAKKAKRKIEGARSAIEKTKKQLEKIEEEEKLETKKAEKPKPEKKWYENFRWFISSEGFLCIGGRDATTNEIVIKKHTNSDDLVFHTDLAGSPFFVVKSEGKKIGKPTMEETAQATASFSKAWKLGLSVLEVFYVNPEQVSKEAKAGEYMGKGAFMIYGKTNYITAELKLCVGLLEDGKPMCGPVEAVKKNCKEYFELIPGSDKPSDIAKRLKKRFDFSLDDIIRILPSGNIKLISNTKI